MILVEKKGTNSIPLIRQEARVTWAVAYADIISPEQMEYMLELFYSDAALLQQMEDGHQFIIASENGTPLGFAAYSPKNRADRSVFRLHKIYINPHQQGKGIGKLLLDFIINDIRPAGASELELNVNRHNKALGFYKKYGFSITREEDIDIGQGYYMNDYVMRLDLES